MAEKEGTVGQPWTLDGALRRFVADRSEDDPLRRDVLVELAKVPSDSKRPSVQGLSVRELTETVMPAALLRLSDCVVRLQDGVLAGAVADVVDSFTALRGAIGSDTPRQIEPAQPVATIEPLKRKRGRPRKSPAV